ncbi:hypothetical protein DOS62_06575 [Staphylococcus felis]|uniref:hypothetical protein n=1 Tax=Staphylococcus felis TaxID=46127 RepID=UPI000E243FF9|nr:hypothetical protein [Staphylococcus felis]REI04050.1 hypothetical protein DOS62_06575 [Staphylococcus felis]
MKIKTKKEMTLPQLIQWAWENGIKHKEFTGSKNGIVELDFRGWLRTDLIELDEIFTVDVEEEITEETVIPRIIGIYQFENGVIGSKVTHNVSIKDVLCGIESITPLGFYMFNDDMTLTLIWKDGEMVE